MDMIISGKYKDFDYITVNRASGTIRELGRGSTPRAGSLIRQGLFDLRETNAHSHRSSRYMSK